MNNKHSIGKLNGMFGIIMKFNATAMYTQFYNWNIDDFHKCIIFMSCHISIQFYIYNVRDGSNVVSRFCFWFWRYLTRGLIWHLSQSSIGPSIYFSSIVRLWYHARIRFWNLPVLSNKGKVSCSRKQQGTFDGADLTSFRYCLYMWN